MIKKYIKSSLLLGAALLMGTGCTGDFEDINTNPYQIPDSEVKMGDLFNEAQLSIFYNQSNGNWEYQLIQNLNADLYSGYLAIPTAFNGGNNNDNYFMMNGWNGYTFNYMLLHVVKPELAKEHAVAAIQNKYGLLKNKDIEVKDANTRNPQALIARDYNDCGISANYETILKGYNDPRLEATVQGVGWGGKGDIYRPDGTPAGMEGQIKGIRNGLKVDGSSYKMYSIVKCPASGGPYSTDVPMPIMSRAESSFLEAEAALRGWTGGDVKALYEEGIRNSFAKYGFDATEYINGETTQIDYEDPHNPANNIAAVNDVPVKFLAGGSKEQQLQQIITQKWIAGFPEGLNAWAEYRRTGYPKLFPIPADNNNVQSEYLGGSADELTKIGIRRLPFSYDERSANPAGLAEGVAILSARGQKDAIDSRLWWDTGRNF